MALAEDILNRAIEIGDEKAAKAEDLVEDAITASLGSSGVNVLPTPDTPAVVEPPVNIPANATGLDIALFNSTYQRIIDDLSNAYAQFLTDYFPINGGLMAAVEQWLFDAINGGTGVNAAVEAAIWQRERDRINTASAAQADEAVSAWAARGFPLPPGAAVAAVQAIERKRVEEINNQSREIAINAFKTEIENVRFAVRAAIDYRTAAIAAAGDYIRAIALGPQLATQIATAASDAQARLISAASTYYNARINVAQLAQQKNLTITDYNLRAALQTSSNTVDYSRLRADTAMAGAQSLGQQAAAALNAVNATAQIIEAAA
jgi:hypothetical protein